MNSLPLAIVGLALVIIALALDAWESAPALIASGSAISLTATVAALTGGLP